MHCLLNALYDDAEMIEDSDKRCLKKKIYVQLDNCSRENKNKYLLALLALLVKWKKTEEVFVNFLMVGHTHEDIDQRFSLISRRLKRKPTRSIPEFAEEVQQSMDKISVKGVNKVYDVREWLTPFMAIIGGHSEPHSFWIFEKKPGHVALKFKAWPKDIEWLPSGSCLELFKENKDGSQLVPQGVPQVVEPDWAKLELDLVKANLKNIKDLMLDSINNWWTEFFEDPSILRKESEDFWVMDRLSSMKGQTDTGFGSPSVVSPLSYVMEKERKVPMVYNGRKRKIFEEKEQEQDKTEEVMVQHMIVYRENTFIKYGKVIGASNDIVCIQCYRLVGNDILKEVVSRKGDVQTINIKKEHILPNLVFILPASNRIPQRIKLACFDLK
ncbi:Hypothetical predicted protein [Mytilus galloprovincialis]|uniref:DUF7869 domain-containing protein n=1 Tax=Mytilus galloprovincialis TaxID=29158 RepID=A0A8B6FSK1_MYTGA|nr:Hypothetical predicted protein [Mytilus galloprovincialis]